MAILGIPMIRKLKLNILDLGPFFGAHGGTCRLLRRRMIEYGVFSHPHNMEALKG